MGASCDTRGLSDTSGSTCHVGGGNSRKGRGEIRWTGLPETVLRWHRSLWKLLWRRRSQRPAGRPPVDADTGALIRRMRKEDHVRHRRLTKDKGGGRGHQWLRAPFLPRAPVGLSQLAPLLPFDEVWMTLVRRTSRSCPTGSHRRPNPGTCWPDLLLGWHFCGGQRY